MYKQILTITLLATTFIFAGCSEKKSLESPPKSLQPIDVAEVLIKPVQSWHTYTSRIESPEEVALMPRVSGVIDYIAFKEGGMVKQGDLLFQLDNRPFLAQVSSLKSQVISAKAVLVQAKSEAKRAERLAARKAISTEETESRESILRQREAQAASLQAQLKIAALDLEFTSIVSPINGLISRAQITKGNNVIAGQSVLTSIVSTNKMYAYFDIDERTWNKSFSDVTAQSKQQVIMQKVGQDSFAFNGYIDFIDNTINPSTGTLRVRATFENADHKLRSGSFARIKLAANKVTQQILVPSKAIGTDLKNRFVLTVDEKNILQYKLVTVGERYGKLHAITSGLAPGDIIAVNGPARVGPGMPISPNKIVIDSSGIAFTLSNPSETNLLASR